MRARSVCAEPKSTHGWTRSFCYVSQYDTFNHRTRQNFKFAFGKLKDWVVILGLSSFVVFTSFGSSRVHAQRRVQPVDAERVEQSIRLAVDYLLGAQLDDGGWTEFHDYTHGVTGLVTLALLNSGLPPEHPDVSRALNLLSDKELDRTYIRD